MKRDVMWELSILNVFTFGLIAAYLLTFSTLFSVRAGRLSMMVQNTFKNRKLKFLKGWLYNSEILSGSVRSGFNWKPFCSNMKIFQLWCICGAHTNCCNAPRNECNYQGAAFLNKFCLIQQLRVIKICQIWLDNCTNDSPFVDCCTKQVIQDKTKACLC